MSEWHEFFLAEAGVAAVLTGLVFIGVSINLDKIMSNPGHGLPGRALEALVLLMAVSRSDIFSVGSGAGDGAGRSRDTGGRDRRLGGDRDHQLL
jgi:hypothetical protein